MSGVSKFGVGLSGEEGLGVGGIEGKGVTGASFVPVTRPFAWCGEIGGVARPLYKAGNSPESARDIVGYGPVYGECCQDVEELEVYVDG